MARTSAPLAATSGAKLPSPASGSIVLPFPPASLSGHAKGHWRGKYAVTLDHRTMAHAATRDAKVRVPEAGEIHIHVRLCPPDRRGDRTNFANRMKPYFDGIADALKVNDARFVPSYEFAPPEKPGCVVVTFGAPDPLANLSKPELVALIERAQAILANRFAEAA